MIGKGRVAGGRLRKKFLSSLPALNKLINGVKKAARDHGFLRGLDGRKLHVRSEHAALNTLLQSAGAVAMKKALTIMDQRIQEAGLIPGVNYEFVGNIHDEVQMEVDEQYADLVGKIAVESIRAAGESFGFRCPLDAEYKVGDNWADTH